jgi:hypothetical protein
VKLPLNIFQILGVSPSASANTILMILEKRLENCPYSGFNLQSLKKRDKLLREFSKLLLSGFSRENRNTVSDLDGAMIADEISIPSDDYAIAGLILLLESGMHSECHALASELMHQIPKGISINSQKQLDLALLIGYASLEQADLYKATRHYEHSSQILESSLILLKTFDSNLFIIAQINERLDELLPFRILDLLSRKTEDHGRSRGIDILKRIVHERGGLDNESDMYIVNSEFKAFFRQIRYYLTVQEQIDLFRQWKNEGSTTAQFLLAISLVASGFSQRKPERLVEALSLLIELDLPELNNTISYINLLLGKVSQAEALYLSLNSDSSNQQDGLGIHLAGDELLGKLCQSCKEWLDEDVLEGYRDIDIDADLEAFFNDKDVTIFIEEQDNKEKQGGFIQGIIKPMKKSRSFNTPADKSTQNNISENRLEKFRVKELNLHSSFAQIVRMLLKSKYSIPFFILLIAFLLFIKAAVTPKKERNIIPNQSEYNYYKRFSPGKKNIVRKPEVLKSPYVRESQLNNQEIKALISAWLRIKSDTLAGEIVPEIVESIASAKAISNLRAEKNENNRKGEVLRISVNVLDIEVLQRSQSEIVFSARLLYSDERTGKTGDIIEVTPRHVFKKTYRLVNNGDVWKVE